MSKEIALIGQFDSPFVGLSENEIFYVLGSPIEYRANCSGNGGFAKGESKDFANEIEMQVLFFKEYPNTHLFPTIFKNANDWICLFFVCKNALCSMFIKGQGLENFKETYKDIVSEKLSLGACIITGTMKEKEGKNELGGKVTYLVPFFKWVKANDTQIERAKEFWATCENGALIYSKSVNEIVEKAKPLLTETTNDQPTETDQPTEKAKKTK